MQKRATPRWLGILALAAVLSVAAAAARATDAQALQDVTIVDLRSGALLTKQTVVWQRSRIIAVGPTSAIALPAATHLIPGKDRFLLPAFWDMHVHIPSASPDEYELVLPLFIAHGVTSVRDMGEVLDAADHRASTALTKRRLDAEARAGLRTGPRIVATASHFVDGAAALARASSAPAFLDAATPEQARALVRYLKDETSADLLKVYSGIPRDSYFALLDEARRAGIVVAGHKPLSVSFVEAADAGQKSIEHAREIIFDSASAGGGPRQTLTTRNSPPAELEKILQAHDPMLLREIFSALVRNDTYYVPTHLTRLFDWKAGADERAYLEDPRTRMLHPDALARALQDAQTTRRKVSGPQDVRTYEQFFRKGLDITRQAHEAGVKIMVGTDAGDSWCFHGSGLHDEMALLVQGGMSPLAVLRAAAVVPAEYVGRQLDFGAVAPGRIADLVLLNDNPLADIRNTRSIHAVLFNGRVFDRAALDKLIAGVKRKARDLRAQRPGGRVERARPEAIQ